MRRISSRIVLGLVLYTLLALLTMVPASGQQPTSPPPTPQRIGYGQTVTGELSIQRPEVLYVFTAQQADAILVTMDVLEGESTLDPLVILVDQSQQNVLAVDNDSGGNHNARLRYVIPSAGTYIIRATTVQGTGDIRGRFTLSLTLGNPTPTPSPTSGAPMIAPIEPGDTVHGDLDDSTPFHLYAVRAKQGEPIIAGMTVTPQGFQTGIYLYGADFKELGRAELGAALNVNAPAEGLYFVMVARAATSGAGAFTLRYGSTAGTTGITISTGQTVRGTIHAGSAVKTYSLTGKAGQAIAIRMRRLSGDLAVYVYVVAIDTGKTLAQATAVNGEAELTTTLPTDGTYAVIATREGQQSGTTTGDYMLSIAPPGQPNAVPATLRSYTPIKYGDKVSSTIDDKSYAVPYVFIASAGDVIQVTMNMVNGDLDPYLILQNANGDTVGEDDDSGIHPNARLQVTISEAGYYGLIATRADLGSGTTTGQFALSLNVVDAAQPIASAAREGALLVPGQAQAGAIGPQLASLFRFEAQANLSVGINVNTAGGLEVVTLLADSNFQEVARSTTGSIRPTLLPRAGTYFVVVARRGGPIDPAFGAFSLTLQGAVNPPTQQASNNSSGSTSNILTFGQAVAGAITKEAYQVRYTVEAKQGTTLLVIMEAAPDSTLNPMVAVLDAEGKLLILNDDAAQGIKNAALIYEVPSDGRYLILATRSGESTGTTTGAYTLKVDVREPVLATQPAESTALPVATLGATVPATIAPTSDAGGSQTITIRYGETITGTITAQKFLNYYSFQGTAGEVITIGMTRAPDSQLDPLLYLYTYEGQPQLIAANNDLVAGSPDAAIVRFKLPQSGKFLIVATRVGAAQGTTEGTYTLTLSRDE